MNENEEKPGDQFEEGLRQILSPEEPAGGSKQQARREPRPTRRIQETIDKMDAERKTLFWLNLLRPFAAAVLIGLLVFFVVRITAER
ncbi:MAG: hypothetical protein LBH93_06750 [Chitinispirillales bacterium]|jgi:hypothetical protein|nr:hypothetical protein [Chitinispirillales bacterium]